MFDKVVFAALFQSTHPVRGGTVAETAAAIEEMIFQSTHPVRGGTATAYIEAMTKADFNPPTP